MDRFNRSQVSEAGWEFPRSTVIDYHHQPPPSREPVMRSNSGKIENKEELNNKVQMQLQMLNPNKPAQDQLSHTSKVTEIKKAEPISSFGMWKPGMSTQDNCPFSKLSGNDSYVEDNIEDMEISDDEKSQSVQKSTVAIAVENPISNRGLSPVSMRTRIEVTSGAAFYKGLILYIPPFEQLLNTYRGSPAVKMLYASFEFSFKIPVRIISRPKEDTPNEMVATVFFKDNIISTGTGWAPHVLASVRALELLSETCYTIQAKEGYFLRCKLINAVNMKTLNLKKWEAVSQKYPKLLEATKDSHIQKTFAVFLDNHTSSGVYEDMVCYNLTNTDVNNIKRVVEFFHLTMLPCSVSTNLTKKETPCVVSIHKYTSAQGLLDILVECGGENDNFKLHPPDTFKEFYKLHQSYWDPSQKTSEIKINDEMKTTLDDEDLQALIMKPYENTISELFEKHKSMPKVNLPNENLSLRKADEFMKETLKIDMAHSKNVAPVQRMQLLLKYMEQLQEYGSRVLNSGRSEMIKIYHNAIDNLRKDLDDCRKDIEKDQKEKTVKSASPSRNKSRSPPRRRTSPQRSKSPLRRRNKSVSPKRKRRSRSPKRTDKHYRPPSPRERYKSPRRRPLQSSPPRNISPSDRRGRSPRRRPLQSSPPRNISPSDRRGRSPRRRPLQSSPPRNISPCDRRCRSPRRRPLPSSPRRSVSPYDRRDRSPRRPLQGSPPRNISPSARHGTSRDSPSFQEDNFVISIFKDQFRRFVYMLRTSHVEIENTPVERRSCFKENVVKHYEQLYKFHRIVNANQPHLKDYLYEMEICNDELHTQWYLITNKAGPIDMHPSVDQLQTSYPLPRGANIPPLMDFSNISAKAEYPY